MHPVYCRLRIKIGFAYTFNIEEGEVRGGILGVWEDKRNLVRWKVWNLRVKLLNLKSVASPLRRTVLTLESCEFAKPTTNPLWSCKFGKSTTNTLWSCKYGKSTTNTLWSCEFGKSTTNTLWSWEFGKNQLPTHCEVVNLGNQLLDYSQIMLINK